MKDSWFFDKNFNGLSDENFDDVINFFDFPLEDVEPDAVEEDWDAQFNHVEEPCYDVLSMAPLGVCDKTRKGNPKHERMSTSVSLSATSNVNFWHVVPFLAVLIR